jgi:hypothetical protein
MTFQDHIKALPEEERLAFFRRILVISEAGRKGGEKQRGREAGSVGEVCC